MKLKKSHIVFVLPILLNCLFISEANGAPGLRKNQQQGFSWKDARLNIEFGWGVVPGGKFLKLLDEDFEIDTHFNYSARMLAGYNFLDLKSSKIGLETGVGYGLGRVIEIPKYNVMLTESHITIPLLVTFQPLQTSFYFASTSIIGYEFDVILSSTYEQSGFYSDLDDSMVGNKDVAEFVPDFSRLSGSIVSGTRFDFPKGIYAAISARLSIEIFSVIKKLKEAGSGSGLTMAFVEAGRYFNTNLLEITVGINIMDWVYPQAGYQGKSSWRKK